MPETVTHIEAREETEIIVLDQRAAKRFRCTWRPLVSFLARAKSITMSQGVICDVSFTGIGLIADLALDPGTLIAIQVRTKQNGFSGLLSAKVVRTVPQENGSYLLGCHLSRRLSRVEQDALLA
ncbi:MAG TPA: PilZ domain-containing protein [Gemmataceae bacterium]|jgi:hypothetical protein|nr:PilZ domain-containing protein [Gemmataceae bacterium]